MMALTSAQKSAIAHIDSYASSRKAAALNDIDHLTQMSNIPRPRYEQAVNNIKQFARVAVHFHPDRPVSDQQNIVESIFASGKYLNQFETKVSNGSLTAVSGGLRDSWEKEVFGGAYHTKGTSLNERPKYGALNLMLHPDGPSPRFGSCYFLLNPKVSKRCTFTYMDSHTSPKEKGTLKELSDLLAAALSEVFTRNFVIGQDNITLPKLISHLCNNLEKTIEISPTKPNGRNLDHYIEAQIHGDIRLENDVDYLVADPSFKNTHIEENFKAICKKYAIKLHWHAGFLLNVEDVPLDFRGPGMPSLAKRIATNNVFSTNMIGKAAWQLKKNPELWKDRGSYDEVLQELKLLWHVLVRFGKPFQGR